MPNAMPTVTVQGCTLSEQPRTMRVNQGDCVNLVSEDGTYQVIGVDDQHGRCWIRRWPIEPKVGSPVFEIALEQITLVGG